MSCAAVGCLVWGWLRLLAAEGFGGGCVGRWLPVGWLLHPAACCSEPPPTTRLLVWVPVWVKGLCCLRLLVGCSLPAAGVG